MKTNKIITLFSVILALFVVLTVSVFAEGEDETDGGEDMVLFAADDTAADTDELDGDAPALLGAEPEETGDEKADTAEVLPSDEPVLTVGATDDTGADSGDDVVGAPADTVDEKAAAEAADSVLEAIGTDSANEEETPADTQPATGTWDNLGTSGLIGIIVAVVLAIAIVVVIIVLIPKKGGQKK